MRFVSERFRPSRAVVTAMCVLALACGGSSTTSSTPVSKFIPDAPNPGSATIALLSGAGNGASINIKITVTGVNGFFGSAFRITYDPDALLFTGWDTSTSFLRDGVTASDVFFAEDHLTNGGTLVITATRIDPSKVSAVDVTTTSTLATLNFVARKPLAAGAAAGRLDFGDPKQVCDGTVAPPGCGSIPVTWKGGAVQAH